MQNIIIFLCGALSFFGTLSLARHTHINKAKPDWGFDKACWATSKFVGILVICGFLAGTFCSGHTAANIFFMSLALIIPAYLIGSSTKGGKK